MRLTGLIIAFFLCALIANAQPLDTLHLPFAIAKEKRLSEEDLQHKKEGVYVTGVPDLSSDPINGFGYGGEGSIFLNGKRNDPFFEYTAYRAKIDLVLFNTTRKQREALVKIDIPYAFNTKWRLRFEGGYESNPNLLYFGNTEKSLDGLSYFPNEDSSKAGVNDASYADYEKNGLIGINSFYNTYIKEEYILNVSGERSFFDGKVRALIGYEIADIRITTFNGNSLLLKDHMENDVPGVGRSIVGILQAGLIYDTRDLEPDPSQGVFAELTNELSLKSIGSAYNFNKTFFHVNVYQNLISNKIKKLVLAFRVAGGYTAGDAPFFEYQDQWSSEGSIEGLGGGQTLRGFKQSRFLSRIMTFNNFELRYRFAQMSVLRQHFTFGLVPFADFGGVWDSFSNFGKINNYRVSEGLGLRIAWNINTILRFDYAVSREDRQFFFNLSHVF
jgi:hypothetical protein